MFNLKNIQISDLTAKLKEVDKKTLIKFGIGFGGIILFLIIYYAVLSPIVKQKKILLDDKILKENEIVQIQNEIIINKKKLKKLEPQYKEQSTLFHSKAEVEGLYQSLSRYACVNGLIISKIEKKKPEEVSKSDVLGKKKKKKKKKATKKKSIKNIAYYKIPVDFEITGNFLGYIKFKRAISLSNKMLNFDKESIKVVKGNTTGAITVNGTLTIVGLADDFN